MASVKIKTTLGSGRLEKCLPCRQSTACLAAPSASALIHKARRAVSRILPVNNITEIVLVKRDPLTLPARAVLPSR